MTSRSTRSGRRLRAISRPAASVPAVSVRKPSRARASVNGTVIVSSSSTSSTIRGLNVHALIVGGHGRCGRALVVFGVVAAAASVAAPAVGAAAMAAAVVGAATAAAVAGAVAAGVAGAAAGVVVGAADGAVVATLLAAVAMAMAGAVLAAGRLRSGRRGGPFPAQRGSPACSASSRGPGTSSRGPGGGDRRQRARGRAGQGQRVAGDGQRGGRAPREERGRGCCQEQEAHR